MINGVKFKNVLFVLVQPITFALRLRKTGEFFTKIAGRLKA